MMRLKQQGLRRCAVVVMALGLGNALPAPAQAQEKGEKIVTGYTAPTEQHRLKLTFRQAGIVKEVAVKEGDKVKAGQVLVQLDDSVEMNQWRSLDLQGNSTLQEQAAKAEMAEKQIELKRFENMVEAAKKQGQLPAA